MGGGTRSSEILDHRTLYNELKRLGVMSEGHKLFYVVEKDVVLRDPVRCPDGEKYFAKVTVATNFNWIGLPSEDTLKTEFWFRWSFEPHGVSPSRFTSFLETYGIKQDPDCLRFVNYKLHKVD